MTHTDLEGLALDMLRGNYNVAETVRVTGLARHLVEALLPEADLEPRKFIGDVTPSVGWRTRKPKRRASVEFEDALALARRRALLGEIG
jgi:hypothetical protein